MSSNPSKFGRREGYIRTASGRTHKLGEGCEEFWHKGVQYLKVVQDPTVNGGSEITGIFTLYHPDTPVWSACPAGTWNEKLRERDATALPPCWAKATVLKRFWTKSELDRARGEGDKNDSTSKTAETGVSKPTKPLALMSPEEFDRWLDDADEEAGEGISDEQFEAWLDGGDSKNDNIATTSKNPEAVASSVMASGLAGYNAVAQYRARLEGEGGNDDDESAERKEINEDYQDAEDDEDANDAEDDQDTDDEPCYDFDPHCGHWGCDHCLRDGETPAWPRVETDDLEEDDPEWEQQWSVEHGKFRYFNSRTQETQWDKPDAPFSPEYGWDPYVAGEM